MRRKVTSAFGSVAFLLCSFCIAEATDDAARASTDAARLAEAVNHKDVKTVQALLKQGVDVSAPQPYGATVLHSATLQGDVPTVDALLAAGAKVDAPDKDGVTPLWLACLNADPQIVGRLLKAGANAQAALPSGETVLMRAAHTGNAEVVRLLLEHHADPNAKEPSQGQTPLMWAAAEGHASAVQTLIAHGADIHARSKEGFTPFLMSARSSSADAAKVFLDAGVDVSEAAPDGTTALIVAILRGNSALARFLLDKGANPNLGPGFTPLHWAVGQWRGGVDAVANNRRDENSDWKIFEGIEESSKLEFVKALLAHGADPNARAQRNPGYQRSAGRGMGGGGTLAGATPFFIAARDADVELMRLLVANGADPSLQTSRHVTPMMAAAGVGSGTGSSGVPERKALEAVKLCWELGNDINVANVEGETALHGAAYRGPQGTETIIQFLVDKGANVNAKNAQGWTPLTIVEGLYFNATTTLSEGGVALLRKLGAEPTPPNLNRAIGSSILNGALNR
jgi:ankyrin repeat protein